MRQIRAVIKRSIIGIAFVLAASLAAPAALAAADPTCTAPSSSTPGVHQPTGSEAVTYTYVCDTSSPYYGEYVNPYYVFDPTTATTSPLYNLNYTYNCTTGVWSDTTWEYNPANAQWYQSTQQTTAPSGISTNCPLPVAPSNSGSTTPSGSDSGSGTSSDDSDSGTAGTNSVADTGPNSDNNSDVNSNNNANLNTNNNATVNNNITGVATSGNALTLDNTTAGGATSGDTDNTADVVNMLQSSDNALDNGGNVLTFTYDINGDVNGNLLLDPADLSTVQNTGPDSTNNADSNSNNNLVVNTANTGDINNNIDLAADSGDATVSGNTTGGDATSGDASTIANVINTIDTAVTAGQSFIGTININGNLNGNILIPPDFVNQLLADNVPTVTLTGPNSDNDSSTTADNNSTVTNTNNEGINNDVTGDANTGTADVSDNTNGGSATSGNATTSITAFNLTGSQVVGANDLLVFVNVSGTWVGLIMNAPAGTTAAELGGGITSSGPNSTNTADSSSDNNASLTNTTNGEINNNIDSSASSGNATVSDNTTGGNATSGDATNAVNLLNVENSSLNLSNWFGILFINVFGNWNGSFGIEPTTASTSNTSNTSTVPSNLAVFKFVPTTSGSTDSTNYGLTPFNSDSSSTASTPTTGPIVASLVKNVNTDQLAPTPKLASGHFNWLLAISGGGAFVLIAGGDRLYRLALRRLHIR